MDYVTFHFIFGIGIHVNYTQIHTIIIQFITSQWRIHNFTDSSGGSRISQRGVRQLQRWRLLFLSISPQNCMKLKKFGPRGWGARPWQPALDLPMDRVPAPKWLGRGASTHYLKIFLPKTAWKKGIFLPTEVGGGHASLVFHFESEFFLHFNLQNHMFAQNFTTWARGVQSFAWSLSRIGVGGNCNDTD